MSIQGKQAKRSGCESRASSWCGVGRWRTEGAELYSVLSGAEEMMQGGEDERQE